MFPFYTSWKKQKDFAFLNVNIGWKYIKNTKLMCKKMHFSEVNNKGATRLYYQLWIHPELSLSVSISHFQHVTIC